MKHTTEEAIAALKKIGWRLSNQRWHAPKGKRYPKLYVEVGLSLREACSIECIETFVLKDTVSVNKKQRTKKAVKPQFISNPTIVEIIESERGWGQKVDEVRAFASRKEAEDFVKDFNSANTSETVPDWYMVARIVR